MVTLALLADAASSANHFIDVFIWVYILLIFVYVLTSWVRLPYSIWVRRVSDFLRDVCEPYLRLFRRILPPLGPLDLTPVELNHIQLKRGLRGYRRRDVDQLIEEIERSFEAVWRERAEYADRIEQLQSELSRHRDLETLLRTTLVTAEKSAHELKAQAKREADLVLEEAHAEARSATRAAAAERERLLADARKVRALLEAALDAVEDASD